MGKKESLYYEVLNEISKMFYKNKCLWKDCKRKSIKSHSHPEKILRNISIENKCYGLNKNFVFLDKGQLFRKYGVKEASVFYGFCPEHDNNLFEYIEGRDLIEIDNKAAFLFFSRGIFFDHFQKKNSDTTTKKTSRFMRKE